MNRRDLLGNVVKGICAALSIPFLKFVPPSKAERWWKGAKPGKYFEVVEKCYIGKINSIKFSDLKFVRRYRTPQGVTCVYEYDPKFRT